jgi:hypothetical protein
MKNIHLLPTENPSRLLKTIPKGNLILSKSITSGSHWENQNIYITSDENTKVGEWTLNMDIKILVKSPHAMYNNAYFKKIILTTDTDLIKDGVQAIDDEFLNWFVKNPTCGWVEVVLGVIKHIPWDKELESKYDYEKGYPITGYKITLPKEEPTMITDERMYSEEEVLEILNQFDYSFDAIRDTIPQWFNQFKRNKFVSSV